MDEKLIFPSQCIQGTPPACSCSCPFNLDIKSMIERIKSGNFNAAYRLFANRVVFPETVGLLCPAPCKTACCADIQIGLLEKACLDLAARKGPIKYALPEKDQTVAVIGSGISGLACARQLSAKKYRVTIFSQEREPGGSLLCHPHADLIRSDIAEQFRYCDYHFVGETEIASLDGLNFDAVYIATGSGGNDFGLLSSWDPQSMATGQTGVFLGGSITGADKMEALSQGITAAANMEYYLQTGMMSGQPSAAIVKESLIPPRENADRTSIIPGNGAGYTEREAKDEASRCLMCDCTLCRDGCEYLKYYHVFPRVAEEKASKVVQRSLWKHEGAREVFACGACGSCGGFCPRHLSLEDIMLQAKADLFDVNGFPPPLHEYFINDMNNAMGECYVAKAAPGHQTASCLLFPGCQISQTAPDITETAYAYLLGLYPDTGLILGCCGVPALWAGDRKLFHETLAKLGSSLLQLGSPTLITLCSTCRKTIDRYLPDVKTRSIYQVLAEKGLPAAAYPINGRFDIFDPCASREYPEDQLAVRKIARELGAGLGVLEYEGEQARCCGMGGHIFPANKQLAVNTVKRAAAMSDHPYLAYCANCRNLFTSVGKQCRHILEFALGAEPVAGMPHISQLRENRRRLRRKLLQRYWGEVVEEPMETNELKLRISPELYHKMNWHLIAEEEVRLVIQNGETTGKKLYHQDTGLFTSSLKIGMVTCWVDYFPEDDGSYTVANVYSHRISFTEER